MASSNGVKKNIIVDVTTIKKYHMNIKNQGGGYCMSSVKILVHGKGSIVFNKNYPILNFDVDISGNLSLTVPELFPKSSYLPNTDCGGSLSFSSKYYNIEQVKTTISKAISLYDKTGRNVRNFTYSTKPKQYFKVFVEYEKFHSNLLNFLIEKDCEGFVKLIKDTLNDYRKTEKNAKVKLGLALFYASFNDRYTSLGYFFKIKNNKIYVKRDSACGKTYCIVTINVDQNNIILDSPVCDSIMLVDIEPKKTTSNTDVQNDQSEIKLARPEQQV